MRRLKLSPGQMVSSLRQRNYRLFFFGQLVSVAGTWMQTVAQSFLVLDLTHSGTQLGLTSAASRSRVSIPPMRGSTRPSTSFMT